MYTFQRKRKKNITPQQAPPPGLYSSRSTMNSRDLTDDEKENLLKEVNEINQNMKDAARYQKLTFYVFLTMVLVTIFSMLFGYLKGIPVIIKR